MHFWRLRPKRSASRQTQSRLRAEWTAGSLAYRQFRVRARLRELPPLSIPVAVSIALLIAPFVAGIHQQLPPWFDGAWQVTGVLIGFGLALFVFLMQSSVDRSFRSFPVFRALVRDATLEWPLGFGLVFIVYVAAASRWADHDGSEIAAWANDLVLGVFVIQAILFARAFVRGVRLLPTTGLVDLMGTTFQEAAREAVCRVREGRVSSRLMEAACDEAGEPNVTAGFSFIGRGVPPDKFGEVKDIDLNLPAALASQHLAGRVALTASIGDPLGDGSELARVDRNLESSVNDLVRRGVAVARRRQDPETRAIFR